MWLSILAIGGGAALGANLRWLLSLWLNALFPTLPPGTLLANLLGSWLIGVAFASFAQMPSLSTEWRLFVVTGFLGALTTFSTFSIEMLANIQTGRWGMTLAGIALHVGGSLGMAALGMATFGALRHLAGMLK